MISNEEKEQNAQLIKSLAGIFQQLERIANALEKSSSSSSNNNSK